MSNEKKKSFRKIAAELSLSPATVSRIAGGVGSYSESTRKTVINALLQAGYTIGGETYDAPKTVAAVVTDLSNEIYAAVLSALGRYLSRKGILLEIHMESRDQQPLIRLLEEQHRDGLILVGSPEIPLVTDSLIPAVRVLSASEVRYCGVQYTVRSDEYVGGKLAARELLNHGAAMPVILNTRHTDRADSLRIRGFLDEWAAFGKAADSVYIHDGEPYKSSFNSARDIISYLLAKEQPFDAVFACSDWRAYGALIALKSLNVSVPEAVKVIGFDGSRVSRYSELPFSTIQQNPDLLATYTLRLLLPLIKDAVPEKETLLAPLQVQHGLSV